MWFFKGLLALLFLSEVAFAQTGCGSHPDDFEYPLDWQEVVVYRVNSPYADVYGVLCAGLREGKIKRIHYRDDQGSRVRLPLSRVRRKDVVFLSRASFPAAARWVTRGIDPLTLRVTKEEELEEGGFAYTLSAKFLRNPRKGFSAPDVREISFVFHTRSNRLFYQRQELDEVYLNINGALTINEVRLLRNGTTAATVNPFALPRKERAL